MTSSAIRTSIHCVIRRDSVPLWRSIHCLVGRRSPAYLDAIFYLFGCDFTAYSVMVSRPNKSSIHSLIGLDFLSIPTSIYLLFGHWYPGYLDAIFCLFGNHFTINSNFNFLFIRRSLYCRLGRCYIELISVISLSIHMSFHYLFVSATLTVSLLIGKYQNVYLVARYVPTKICTYRNVYLARYVFGSSGICR
jgi:hypothetical protein